MAVNKPVDRLNLKTQAQRNRDIAVRMKEARLKDIKEKRKFDKDLGRIDNLLKQNENTSTALKKKIERIAKAEKEEKHI